MGNRNLWDRTWLWLLCALADIVAAPTYGGWVELALIGAGVVCLLFANSAYKKYGWR